MAEHLCHVEVEGSAAVSLLEGEVCVAGRFAHHIHRGPFALRDAAYVVEVLLLDEEAHAFLALVGYDFFGREGGVAHGELAHVNQAAAFFHQL